MPDLRPHQIRAINEARDILRRSRSVLIEAPTGAGKTVIAAEMVRLAQGGGRRSLFIAPYRELIDQTIDRFLWWGVRGVGAMQADHELTDPRQPVQIATEQTLSRRDAPEADLIIVDEAHRMSRWLSNFINERKAAGVPVVGLSATPWQDGLKELYGQKVVAATLQGLIDDGLLSPFVVFAPSRPDLSGVRVSKGDYEIGQLSKLMSQKQLVADVVSTWLKRASGRPTICFAVDRAHAYTLQQEFARSGVASAYVDGESDREERNEIRRKFASGEVQVVCNVGVLTTGVDWDVRSIILARPTKSRMLYVQMVGRGLRTAEGKDHCLILDHSDTTHRLGFVTQIGMNDLPSGDRKERAKRKEEDEAELDQPRECPNCRCLIPSKVRGSCPSCGHTYEVVSQITYTDDELVELEQKAKRKTNAEVSWAEKGRFYQELVRYRKERGKAYGYEAHLYKSRFGVFPNDPRVRGAPPADAVSDETMRWVKHHIIKSAKSNKPRPVQPDLVDFR